MADYPDRHGPLPLELASTIYARDGQLCDALATPADLAVWLDANARYFPTPLLADVVAVLDRFRALREALRELLQATLDGAPPTASAIAVLNEFSAAATHWL